MFHWFTDRRRRKLTEAPFPEPWEEILKRNVAHYCMLIDDEKAHLRSLIQVFIAEKNWEGLGGLELTDEIIVTISAQACLLLLGLPHDFYRNILSILIYPSTVVPPQRKLGHFEITQEPLGAAHPINGQSFKAGPVILVWDAVLREGRHPEGGHNVVYHEFAHKLDMLNGTADGTPALHDRAEYEDWVTTCSREYLRLKSEAQNDRLEKILSKRTSRKKVFRRAGIPVAAVAKFLGLSTSYTCSILNGFARITPDNESKLTEFIRFIGNSLPREPEDNQEITAEEE